MLFAFRVGCFCRPGPLVSFVEMEVGFADPLSRFVGMSSSCPLPYDVEDAMVDVAKDRCADHMSMILSPTPIRGLSNRIRFAAYACGLVFINCRTFSSNDRMLFFDGLMSSLLPKSAHSSPVR